MSGAIPLLPLWTFVACPRVKLHTFSVLLHVTFVNLQFFNNPRKIIVSLKCNNISYYLFLLLYPSPIYSLPWGKSP
jgi:hypothetical protein